jgi:hypothetical protein
VGEQTVLMDGPDGGASHVDRTAIGLGAGKAVAAIGELAARRDPRAVGALERLDGLEFQIVDGAMERAHSLKF